MFFCLFVFFFRLNNFSFYHHRHRLIVPQWFHLVQFAFLFRLLHLRCFLAKFFLLYVWNCFAGISKEEEKKSL